MMVSTAEIIPLNGSGSGQGQVDTISVQDGYYINVVSALDQGQVNSSSGQGQVSSIRSGSGQSQVNNSILLAPRQITVYEWFLRHGIAGYFNKGQISIQTGVAQPTVRKSVDKLKKMGIIKTGYYDSVSKLQHYEINPAINVNILDQQVSSIRSGSGHGQVNDNMPLNKTDRQILKKDLSDYISRSDFWRHKGLTIMKCAEWINEFKESGLDAETLIQQLQFAENNEKVRQATSPTKYFYSALTKGGLERPKNFEFPAEKLLRIKNEELEAQKKTLAEQQSIRKQQKAIADELSFNLFLKDTKSVCVMIGRMEQEKRFFTPQQLKSVQLFHQETKIDSRLETSLRFQFFETQKMGRTVGEEDLKI